LYTSVIDKLAEAQQQIASQISDFSTFSSSMSADIDELYANLSYPLSTTLCHSKNFPRATIEAHLANAKEDLKKAESELHELEREWQENVRSEQQLRQELLNMEGIPGQNRGHGLNDEDYSKKAGFEQEIQRIVAESIQALNEIDEVSIFGFQHYPDTTQPLTRTTGIQGGCTSSNNEDDASHAGRLNYILVKK
jgi:chromosome segregation ATPase